MEAAVKLDHVLLAVDGEHDVNAMVEIVAPEVETSGAREPLRVALVVDRSGSMSGRKLEVAKRCASWLVSRLDPRDELALVDYDDEVRLLAPLSALGATHHAAIGRIHSGGSTNLSGGWLKGVEALGRTNGAGPRKVLLLSDRLANVGITEPGVLTALRRTWASRGSGRPRSASARTSTRS
jgi:Ca-activated chloride channel family protein